MDLVDEQHGAHPLIGASALGLFDDGSDLGNPAEHRAERDEVASRPTSPDRAGHDVREGRLAAPRRAPQNHRWNAIVGNGAPQELPLAHQMLLPHQLFERTRAIRSARGTPSPPRLPRAGRAAAANSVSSLCFEGCGFAFGPIARHRLSLALAENRRTDAHDGRPFCDRRLENHATSPSRARGAWPPRRARFVARGAPRNTVRRLSGSSS